LGSSLSLSSVLIYDATDLRRLRREAAAFVQCGCDLSKRSRAAFAQVSDDPLEVGRALPRALLPNLQARFPAEVGDLADVASISTELLAPCLRCGKGFLRALADHARFQLGDAPT